MDKREQIWKSLENEEYRRLFSADVGTGLAFQIKMMRENKGWTQGELGDRADGIAQPTISQLEDPDYGRFSLATLIKLAAAFDVGLAVRFVPFGELVDWTTSLNEERLVPPSYGDERQMSFAGVSDSASWIALWSYLPEQGQMNVDSTILSGNLEAAETLGASSASDFDRSVELNVKPTGAESPQGVREFALAA